MSASTWAFDSACAAEVGEAYRQATEGVTRAATRLAPTLAAFAREVEVVAGEWVRIAEAAGVNLDEFVLEGVA